MIGVHGFESYLGFRVLKGGLGRTPVGKAHLVDVGAQRADLVHNFGVESGGEAGQSACGNCYIFSVWERGNVPLFVIWSHTAASTRASR
jgi:hypothetical protein